MPLIPTEAGRGELVYMVSSGTAGELHRETLFKKKSTVLCEWVYVQVSVCVELVSAGISVCVCVRVCCQRTTFLVDSLLSLCAFWGLNSGQAWKQALSVAGPPLRACKAFLVRASAVFGLGKSPSPYLPTALRQHNLPATCRNSARSTSLGMPAT